VIENKNHKTHKKIEKNLGRRREKMPLEVNFVLYHHVTLSNPKRAKHILLYLKDYIVPRSKHFTFQLYKPVR